MNPAGVGYVEALHRTVDGLVQPLAAGLGDRLMCRRGCTACCVDDLTVFEVEAALICDRHADVLAGAAAPLGACAMLGASGQCRVYASRPYVCRTQGLPLRWAEAGAERRDICPLNDEKGDLLALPAADCWTIGPVEQRLAAAQARAAGGEGARVALRSLFSAQASR